MDGSAKPFIAVIGGLWNITDEKQRAAAKEKARVIGEELAKAGFGLVVHGANSVTAVGPASWKKRSGVPPLLPARKYPAFSGLDDATGCKIFIRNKLRPKYSF